ncbi:MAG TPA: metal-dependent hydrolase [Spirochaetota bacterium]|nr:metal-dependent hydrolase [Spirochaetota bacterium]HQO00808.1 metal-dependent hydrolase [Spirochaetota bacterium]HQP48019.1 metal-dependent hydrolase [Spirochaetota bacterium]
MQLGHVAVAFAISSYAPELTNGNIEAFSMEAVAVSFIAHWLPNLDVIPIWLGIVKDSFHCTWSHSLLFAGVVTLLVLPFNVWWAVLGLVSLLIHFLADMPSSVGLPLLMPWRRRFTINLWADTGHSGWIALKGTYMQAWTWLLEGGAFLFLYIRAYQEGVWPFL